MAYSTERIADEIGEIMILTKLGKFPLPDSGSTKTSESLSNGWPRTSSGSNTITARILKKS